MTNIAEAGAHAPSTSFGCEIGLGTRRQPFTNVASISTLKLYIPAKVYAPFTVARSRVSSIPVLSPSRGAIRSRRAMRPPTFPSHAPTYPLPATFTSLQPVHRLPTPHLLP